MKQKTDTHCEAVTQRDCLKDQALDCSVHLVWLKALVQCLPDQRSSEIDSCDSPHEETYVFAQRAAHHMDLLEIHERSPSMY